MARSHETSRIAGPLHDLKRARYHGAPASAAHELQRAWKTAFSVHLSAEEAREFGDRLLEFFGTVAQLAARDPDLLAPSPAEV